MQLILWATLGCLFAAAAGRVMEGRPVLAPRRARRELGSA
jgi:hypothetical protein